MSAYGEILELLEEGEKVQKVIFGDWGWGGFREPTNHAIPAEKRYIPLDWEEAQEYMKTWDGNTGFGSPTCYATYVYTNKNIFYISEYDGSTGWNEIPRRPRKCKPYMPGG